MKNIRSWSFFSWRPTPVLVNLVLLEKAARRHFSPGYQGGRGDISINIIMIIIIKTIPIIIIIRSRGRADAKSMENLQSSTPPTASQGVRWLSPWRWWWLCRWKWWWWQLKIDLIMFCFAPRVVCLHRQFLPKCWDNPEDKLGANFGQNNVNTFQWQNIYKYNSDLIPNMIRLPNFCCIT